MSDNKIIITVSTGSLPSWWPYIDRVVFTGYVGEDVSGHITYVEKSEHGSFPFRYLVNTTRCIYIGGKGGIVAFIKDNKVKITLRDMDFDLALLTERRGIQQGMLKTELLYGKLNPTIEWEGGK